MMTSMTADALKLLVFDDEDLAVMSAHVQDMSVRAGDMGWFPADQAFALAGERFDWISAEAGSCERVECGLHFDRVLRVRRQSFDSGRTLNLLSIMFEATDAAAGVVTLAFSGGPTIQLDVECLEAHLRDLGPRRPCEGKPGHSPAGDGAR